MSAPTLLKPLLNATLYRKVFFLCVLLVLMAITILSFFYLFSSYDDLVRWYLGLNGCFYKNSEWAQQYFTQVVKAQGNYFSVAALLVSIVSISYIVLRRKQYFFGTQELMSFDKSLWKWYVLIGLGATCLWYWGYRTVAPSGDEILAAAVGNELPPFQFLSYYYLPNNHVYYNLLNSYFARIFNLDFVMAGRILSLFAYIITLCVVFRWLSQKINNKLFAFIALVPVSLQFLVWGYSFQERGYAYQLMCCWLAFISLLNYADTSSLRALRINTFFSILGFAIIPTFLYYYVAQVVFMVLVLLYRRKLDLIYFKYLVISVGGIFLLYLPALLFSGKDMIAGNSAVFSVPITMREFTPLLIGVGEYYVNFIFSFLIKENHPINFILFLFPLILFFTGKKGDKKLALFYVTLWIVWILICLQMRRTCLNRHMILYDSLSLAIVVLAVFRIVEILKEKLPFIRQIAAIAFFVIPVLLFSWHLYVWDDENKGYAIAFENVAQVRDFNMRDLALIPPHSTVAYMEDRYCFYYYCHKGPYIISRCPSGNEDYFVTGISESLPANFAPNYVFLKRGLDQDIYKHK